MTPAREIFQLTTSRRGRLVPTISHANRIVISTHDLTKRSTFGRWILRRKKAFQLTTSRRGRRKKKEVNSGFYIFQLTTSRRGRLSGGVLPCHFLFISTHDLTKRSTRATGMTGIDEKFQLTTSRRGRPGGFQLTTSDKSFQLTTSRRGRR